jgi:hypothetical protein
MKPFIILVLVSSALAIQSSSQITQQEMPPLCYKNSDCPSSSICYDGSCVVPCNTNTECPSGTFCPTSATYFTPAFYNCEITKGAPLMCKDSEDCPSGFTCSSNNICTQSNGELGVNCWLASCASCYNGECHTYNMMMPGSSPSSTSSSNPFVGVPGQPVASNQVGATYPAPRLQDVTNQENLQINCESSSQCPNYGTCTSGGCAPNISQYLMPTCKSDAECTGGSVCQTDGVCRIACQSNSECPLNLFCGYKGYCEIGSDPAYRTEPIMCSTTSQCPWNSFCVASRCQYLTLGHICKWNHECPPDQMCFNGWCYHDTIWCRSDQNCRDGTSCHAYDGYCYSNANSNNQMMLGPPCNTNAECVFKHCINGNCELGSQTPAYQDLTHLSCTIDNDCPTKNSICTNSNCVPTCTDDWDCPPQTACREGICMIQTENGFNGPPTMCRSTTDCSDYACIEHVCASSVAGYYRDCKNNADCGHNMGVCYHQICFSDFQVCTTDQNCPPHQRCFSGKCQPYCTSNSECSSPSVCVNSECQYPQTQQEEAPPSCSNDEDCENLVHNQIPLTCQNGICFKKCQSETDCFGSQICNNGACQDVCNSTTPCSNIWLKCSSGFCVANLEDQTTTSSVNTESTITPTPNLLTTQSKPTTNIPTPSHKTPTYSPTSSTPTNNPMISASIPTSNHENPTPSYHETYPTPTNRTLTPPSLETPTPTYHPQPTYHPPTTTEHVVYETSKEPTNSIMTETLPPCETNDDCPTGSYCCDDQCVAYIYETITDYEDYYYYTYTWYTDDLPAHSTIYNSKTYLRDSNSFGVNGHYHPGEEGEVLIQQKVGKNFLNN